MYPITQRLLPVTAAVLIVMAWVGAEISAAQAQSQTQSQERQNHQRHSQQLHQLIHAAMARTKQFVRYDGSYRSIPYPGGDVPKHIGVCTDVVIRSYRQLGLDLQQLVYEDMRQNFALYPSKRIWGLTRPDTNIDHRRVPNLQTFFSRFGQTLPATQTPEDYNAGDIVTWMLPGNAPHIGVLVPAPEPGSHPWVVHNIGLGPRYEDVLFDYTITGHYRYLPGDTP